MYYIFYHSIGDPDWHIASNLTLNQRITKTPGATIYVTTELDIAVVVNFTQKYDMDLKITSSGRISVILCLIKCETGC